jgi:hypothetical protein
LRSTEKLHVRPGKKIPIPYFELPLVEDDQKLDVKITIGPNPEMALALQAVETLMASSNCRGAVKPSTVPYREL